MKHLLNGVAIAAALVIAAPVWAQNPSGGNAVGTPGPNPGGPGLTPYSGGAPAAPPASEPAPAAMPPAAEAPNSAMPPAHRHVHEVHVRHHVRVTHHVIHHGPRAAGDTTAELNRAELARIQSGNTGAAPAPQGAPGGEMQPMPEQSVGRMPGPKPSGSGYIPPSPPPQPQ